jgi:AcrR family transcriptional regulator
MPRRPRTSPRRAPRQKRAADTVGVLLDATEIVLAKRGFHATTTNRIAVAAGVSIGTLYHYFPSTEALIEAVVHRMWQRELDALLERAHLLVDAPLDVAVREIVGALVACMAAKQPLYKRWYGEASHLGQLGRGLEMSNAAIAMLTSVLETRRSELRPANLEFAADLVVKTALAVVRTGARDYPRETKSGELAAELSAMLARYLVK